MTTPVLLHTIPSRRRPQKNPDNLGDGIPERSGSYGESYALSLVSKAHLLADEGSYFFSCNPTSGTGVAGQTQPNQPPGIGSNDTKPFIVVQNTDPPSASDSRRTYFDYIRFRTTAVGAAGASLNFCVITDTAMAPRAPTGVNSQTPINPNMDDNTASACKVWAGNISVASTNSGRLFPNLQLRSTITVASDIYIVNFGPVEYSVGTLAATLCTQVFGHPPVVIGPGQWALFYLWMPSQTGASSFEFDFGFWDR